MNEKIKDDAREKIAFVICDNRCDWNTHQRCTWNKDGKPCPANLKFADQILSLFGETDEVCPTCKGEGKLYWDSKISATWKNTANCSDCCSTGTIRVKWHIEIKEG